MTRPNKTIAQIQSEYMNQYNAKVARDQRRKKRLMQRLIMFSVVVAIVFGTMTMYHVNQRSIHAEKAEEFEQLQKQMTFLDKQEKELQEEIDLLSDKEYILDIARTNYFLSKKGELIFQVQDGEDLSY